jgi:hypothetical protein
MSFWGNKLDYNKYNDEDEVTDKKEERSSTKTKK